MEFYDNLLQVTIGYNGMVFDLDSNPFKEVDSIERIDQVMSPDTFVNTGFINSTSENKYAEEVKYAHRRQVIGNEYCNLLMEKTQDRFKDREKVIKITGMIYRMFADIDLNEL